MAVRGWVQACEWQPRGSELTADAAIGATVLYVEDLTDFDDAGGMVAINDEFYTYPEDAIDEDAGTLTLDLGLVAAATVGDPVNTLAGGQLIRDVVLFVACGDGDLVEVTAGFAQRDYWAEGDYDDPVQVLLSDDLEEILDAPGRIPASVELKETKTDLETSLEQLEADLIELNEVTLPQVQADLADAVSDLTSIAGLFPISSTSISDGAISTPKLAANAVTADKILGNTITGAKIVGLTITGDKIAANTIGADKIVANSIGAGQIAANAITADKIAANAIDGKTISSAVLLSPTLGSGGGNIDVYDDMALVGATTTLYVQGAVTTATTATFGGTVTTPRLNGSDVYVTSTPSESGTGLGAVYMGSTGRLRLSSSAAKYKTNIEPLNISVERFLELEPVTYDPIDGEDVAPTVGFIADQADELGFTHLVGYREGEVETLHYERLSAYQQVALRELWRQRIEDRALIDALIARIEALEAS